MNQSVMIVNSNLFGVRKFTLAHSVKEITMSRTGSQKHTHRYMKLFQTTKRADPTWKCSIPGCTHFLPYGHPVIGRKSICYNCGEEFIIESQHMKFDMPECDNCYAKKHGLPTAEEILNAVEPEKATQIETIAAGKKVTRTPARQAKYEKEMQEMYGPNWRVMIGETE